MSSRKILSNNARIDARLTKSTQTSYADRIVLTRAIVTIFLNLIKADPHRLSKERLHYLLHSLHNSFHTSELSYADIQKAISELMPPVDAMRIIQCSFTYPEKLMFVFLLLQIVYHEPEFNILESLEVIELVDYLYIRLEHYDALLDYMDGVQSCLTIPASLWLQDEINHFSNVLKLGAYPEADVPVPDYFGRILIFDLTGRMSIIAEKPEYFILNQAPITSDTILCLNPDDTLAMRIRDGARTVTLDFQLIQQLFQDIKNQVHKAFTLQTEKAFFSFEQAGARLTCTLQKGEAAVSGAKLKQGKKHLLLLTDYLTSGSGSLSATDLYGNRLQPKTEQTELSPFYIEKAEDLLILNPRHTKHSLVRLSPAGQLFEIERITPAAAIFVNETKLTDRLTIKPDQDILSINDERFTISAQGEITRQLQDIQNFQVIDLYHRFPGSEQPALNHIQFSLSRGDMLAVMGASGSGKTTLLKTLLGELLPEQATILVDGKDLITHRVYFQNRIGYVPQDDLLFTNLTVYDNLYYCSQLRCAGSIQKDTLIRKINSILRQVGLYEKRKMIVGDSLNKKLSGGERKRLNVALELVTDPQIIIMDEPTSGLSSKDSEKLLQLLQNLRAQGKIIISTIHQPNPELFAGFSHLLLLDYGGTEVYFGDTHQVFDYFDLEYQQMLPVLPGLVQRRQLRMPEFMFDLLDAANASDPGQRIFPPQYWEEKYKQEKIIRLIQQEDATLTQEARPAGTTKTHQRVTLKQQLLQMFWLLSRNLRNSFSSNTNLLVTFLGTPLLCVVSAFVLRYAPAGESYSIATNVNYPLYLFISIIIFIFLGMAGSLDEILSERRIIIREAQLNIGLGKQLVVKSFSLTLFTFIQMLEYYLLSSLILQVRGAFLPYCLYLMLAGMTGFSLGLVCSVLMKDRKAIINVLPLVLIPQILFAGAVVSFDKMNARLKILSQSDIPEFCEIIPSRWLFEGFCTAHTDLNRWDVRINGYNRRIQLLRGEKRLRWSNYKQRFCDAHGMEDYRNDELHKMVNIETGAYYNRGGVRFLSRYNDVFGKRYSTWLRNAWVCIIYVFLLQFLSLIFLYGYKRKQQ